MGWIAAAFAAVILLGLLLSRLWESGLLTFQVKRALFFAASRGKARYSVRVSACTGFVKRGLRLDGAAPYRFWLEGSPDRGGAAGRGAQRGLPPDFRCPAACRHPHSRPARPVQPHLSLPFGGGRRCPLLGGDQLTGA